jgi:beta-galactosidase
MINLPHSWNDKDVLDDEPGYYRGIGWYKKNLYVDSSFANKNIFLHFEGVNQEASVFVNGKLAGIHLGGYTAFSIEITSLVHLGKENAIAIKVDNRHNPSIPPLSADFTFYGGIYRDVYLIAIEKVHFNLSDHGSMGVFINTPEVSKEAASVLVKAYITNSNQSEQKLQLVNLIKDANNKLVASLTKSIKIKPGGTLAVTSGPIIYKNPKLWSPSDPYLYTVVTQILSPDGKILIDEVVNPLGFRLFKFDANNGFYLNGEPLKLVGVNRHQDYYGIANALSNEMHLQDMQLIKDMGANFVRLAHYPHDPYVYNLCDKLGLIVWAEIPIVNDITVSDDFFNNCKNMQVEMVKQQYNHPSIVMWGYMNEIYGGLSWGDSKKVSDSSKMEVMKKTVDLAKEIDSLTRAEDPSRVTAMAIHGSNKYLESGIANVPQVLGLNLYFGWYSGVFEDFGKYVDNYHKSLPDKPLIISEYGAGSYLPLHSYNPVRYDHSMEWQELFIESHYKQIMERQYIAGSAQWNFVDFVAESRGDFTPHYNNKGIVTSTRKPKSIYWFYKASLTDGPLVKFAINGWTNRVGIASEGNELYSNEKFKIYSNADEVSLYDNGKLIGTKNVVSSTVVFDLAMNSGKHQLLAKGTKSGWGYECIDLANIDIKVLGKLNAENFSSLAVNIGSNCWFIDPESNNIWVPEKKYSKGSYGWVSQNDELSETLRIGKHIAGSGKDPIFQTSRSNLSAFRFDVADGFYEVEILFVYPQNNTAFDILVNGVLAYKFTEAVQKQIAITKKISVKAEAGQGVEIQLKPIKGAPYLNGVKITKQGY